MRNGRLERQEKAYAKAVYRMWIFKDYDTTCEKFGIRLISRDIQEDLDINDDGLRRIEEYIQYLESLENEV